MAHREGEGPNAVCLPRATHGTALQTIAAHLTVQGSSAIRLTAGAWCISYKYSKVWKMENDWWVQQSGVNLEWYRNVGKEISGPRKKFVKTQDGRRISAAFSSSEFSLLCSSSSGFSLLLSLGGSVATLWLSSEHGFFSLCRNKWHFSNRTYKEDQEYRWGGAGGRGDSISISQILKME